MRSRVRWDASKGWRWRKADYLHYRHQSQLRKLIPRRYANAESVKAQLMLVTGIAGRSIALLGNAGRGALQSLGYPQGIEIGDPGSEILYITYCNLLLRCDFPHPWCPIETS